ncbi:MAG TPA: hypothetical protein VM582_06065, partial [Candidatus Thermoplasmatota archaeon]|nr:hypothetical protein [Candidatus Thermoplasmatota archaeon]
AAGVATDHADATLGGALDGGAAAGDAGGSLSLDAVLHGMLEVMGELVAHLSTTFTAVLGF